MIVVDLARLMPVGGLAMDEIQLQKCIDRLVKMGRRDGGFVTYESISSTFEAKRAALTIPMLDRVHSMLSNNHIEIVEVLPPVSVVPPGRDSLRLVRSQSGPLRKRYADYYAPAAHKCLEVVIDKLIQHAEAGTLDAALFGDLIESTGIPDAEMFNLVDYLCSRGTDLPCDVVRMNSRRFADAFPSWDIVLGLDSVVSIASALELAPTIDMYDVLPRRRNWTDYE